MSPRSAKQFDDIRKEKKQLIMDTALKLFAEHGFHATSISQIAKKAGISKGLTYNYFNSKKEILDEIVSTGFNTMYGNLDLNHDGILTENEFIHFIKKSFAMMQENTEYWRLYYSLMIQPAVSDSFQEEYMEKTVPVMKMLYQFAESKGSKDPESDTIAISAILEGSYLFAVTAPDYFPAEKLQKTVIDACFKIINN